MRMSDWSSDVCSSDLQADADVRVADLRVVGGKDHVAEQRQRRAEADRVAVEPADQRLVEIEDAGDHAFRAARLLIEQLRVGGAAREDRKSTRLNSSH